MTTITPGSLIKDDTVWAFPMLKSVDSKNNIRYWQIFVELYRDDNKSTPIEIRPEYLNNKVLKLGYVAKIYVEAKVKETGKVRITNPTYVTSGKNIGKKNETNVLMQALRDALGRYNKQKKTLMLTDTPPTLESSTETKETMSVEDVKRFPPMLLKSFYTTNISTVNSSKVVTFSNHNKVEVDFDEEVIYVQRKFDGVRIVAHIVDTTLPANASDDRKINAVDIYSRNMHPYPGFNALKLQIYDILINYTDIYLDGELYLHGMSLQDISGMARSCSDKDIKSETLQFHIFDAFKESTTKKSITFAESKKLLDIVLRKSILTNKPHIQRVESFLVKNLDDVKGYLLKFLDDGYEGAIVRRAGMPYTFSYNNYHATSALKLKPKLTDEFKIVGYTEGTKGKDKGAIIWMLVTESGEEFNAVPKGLTYKERYQLFSTMTKELFEQKYKGKPMTVEYEALSDKKVPLRAKAVAVRDYE